MNNRLQEWLDFLNVTTEERSNMLERNAVVDDRTLYEIENREFIGRLNKAMADN